jgi:hypothetical protein
MDVQTANKTARLTVLLSPEDKRSIEQRARGLDMSVGEYVRRASQSYEPELDYETLEAVVKTWHDNTTHMRQRIAKTIEHVDRRLAEIAELRKARNGTC